MKQINLLCTSFLLFCAFSNKGITRNNGSNFLYVDAQINGKLYKLMVDTGSTHTVLANWLNLKSEKKKSKGKDSGGNEVELEIAIVGDLQVLGQQFKNKEFITINTPKSFKQENIGGFLSPQSFYKNKPFFLDLKNAQISSKPFAGKHKSRLAIKPCKKSRNKKYLVNVKVNNVLGWFYLDSGGVRSSITESFAKKLKIEKSKKIRVRTGAGRSRTVHSAGPLTFTIGTIIQKLSPDIEKKISCSWADGKLGVDFLSKYGVLIDKDRRYMSFFL